MPSLCPSVEDLKALLANQLSAADLASLAEHLETCEDCRRRLENLAGGMAWLSPHHLRRGDLESRPSLRLRAVMDGLRSFSAGSGRATPSDSHEAKLDFLSPSDQPGIIGRFGPYEILEEIARGGMGIVLKAHDPALDRIVAIKVLAPTLATHQAARSRFLREARAAAAISHEHVVDIHAVDEANGLPYLVMQLIPGKSLAERIRASGPLRLEEILRIGTQIAAGLAAAHAQGLIHRDIKPANILLENGIERVRITDFGLARAVDEISTTQSGLLAGTPEFMAPEQARGEPVDHRADLFSLGCVLYCMAVGESPFAASTLLSVIRKLCDEEARPVCEVNPALPGWFGEIVGQLLAKDPAQRPQSAQAVAETLEHRLALVQGSGERLVPRLEPEAGRATQGVSRPPPWRWTRRQRIAVVFLGAAGLVVCALLLAYVATRPPGAGAQGAFHVLRTEGKAPGAFSTLKEAVGAARSGDTIEVSTDGPFELEPVALGNKALTIRAASGSHPVFVSQRVAGPVLTTEALLVLEGLEFRAYADDPAFARRPPPWARLEAIVRSRGAPLFLANCRFQTPFRRRSPVACGVEAVNSPYAELRNCEMDARPGCGVLWVCNASPAGGETTNAESRLWMENCVQLCETTMSVAQRAPVCTTITLLHNTASARLVLDMPSLVAKPGLSLYAGTNVFDCPLFLKQVLREGGGELKDALHWKESHNFFSISLAFSGLESGTNAPNLTDLTAWNRYWSQTNTGSAYRRSSRTTPFLANRADIMTANDFKLTSWHYEQIAAGGGNRALAYGAVVELVGPGHAYDTWRRSPQYRQWQERIRQFNR